MSQFYKKDSKLYFTPQDHIAPEGSGIPDARNITGDAETDSWLQTLDPKERASAIAEIQSNELSAEDINELVKRGGFRFRNRKEFETWEAWKKDQETSLIQDMGNAAGEIGRVFKDLAVAVYRDPKNALKKGIPSVLEGAAQNLLDTYGMVTQSANPDSVFFGFKDALYGTGTVESRMAQTNNALSFLDRSMRLYEGKETLLVDKSYIDPDITRAMTYIADPTMFIPFGSLAMKGARVVGAGNVLTKAAIRANKIKANVLGGAIKWGAGAPIEAIGGALRDSIEYGINKSAGAFESLTGVSAKETAQAMRLAGAGTATAHVAGVTVPFAGPLSTAYVGGGAARGFGSALRMVGDKIMERQGHRGVLSYAKEVIEETKNYGKLAPQTETFLKILDKADPVFSYAHDMFMGAAQGMFIGGALGYLNDKKQGMAMGMGMGVTLGAGGALLGRGVADVIGSTRRMREEITADFVLRVLKEKDQTTAQDLMKVRDDPRTTPQIREVLNKVIVMLDRAEEPIIFRAHETTAEFKKWKEQNPEIGGISDAEFRNAEGWTIRRRDGNVEIGLNMENFFGTDRRKTNKYAPNTIPHEFLHAIFEASVLGPHFKEMARDLMIGVRDKDGKIIQKGVMSIESVREFMLKYVSNAATGVNSQEKAKRANELRKQVDAALDAWKNEGAVGSTTKLTQEQAALLKHLTEEMSAYYFGHWFQGKSMEYFLRGGELEGMSAFFEYVGDAWKDFWQDNLEAHEPRLKFYRNENIEAGFLNNGKRVRIGAMDYFMRDIVRATSQIRKTGILDLSRMSSGMVDNLLKQHGIDDIIGRDASGRAKIKPQKRYDAEMAQRNAEIYRVLDSLDPAKRTSTKGPDGVIRGPFSEFELKTLVQAGLLTEGYAEKLRLIQEAVDDKTKTNVMWFSYLGESMETAIGPNPPRVYGSKVAVKNRKALVIGYNFEVAQNGQGAFRIRTLDLAVIERRGKTLWMDENVRNLWGGDYTAYTSDFMRYLANVSKPKNDPTRVPSAVLLGEAGDLKRDVLHQVAGFAKADDLAYINSPLAPIPRGMLSSVTDFTVGRMFNLRGLGQRIVYEHQNAFHDIAANFKYVDLTNRYRDYEEEEVPKGKITTINENYEFFTIKENGKEYYVAYKKDTDGADKEIIYRSDNFEDFIEAVTTHFDKTVSEANDARDKFRAETAEALKPIQTRDAILNEAKQNGDLRKSQTFQRLLADNGVKDENVFLLTLDEQYRLGEFIFKDNEFFQLTENYGPWRLAADYRNGGKRKSGERFAALVHFSLADPDFISTWDFKKISEKDNTFVRGIVGKPIIHAASSSARAGRHSKQMGSISGPDPISYRQARGILIPKNALQWSGPSSEALSGMAKGPREKTILQSKQEAIKFAKANGHDVVVFDNQKYGKRTDNKYDISSGDRHEFLVIDPSAVHVLQTNFEVKNGVVSRTTANLMEQLPRKAAVQDLSIYDRQRLAMVLRRNAATSPEGISPDAWDSASRKLTYVVTQNGVEYARSLYFKPKDEVEYATMKMGEWLSNDSELNLAFDSVRQTLLTEASSVLDGIVGIAPDEFVRLWDGIEAGILSSPEYQKMSEGAFALATTDLAIKRFDEIKYNKTNELYYQRRYWIARESLNGIEEFMNNFSETLRDYWPDAGVSIADGVDKAIGPRISRVDGKLVDKDLTEKVVGNYLDALRTVQLIENLRKNGIDAVTLDIPERLREIWKVIVNPELLNEKIKNTSPDLLIYGGPESMEIQRIAQELGQIDDAFSTLTHILSPDGFKKEIETTSNGLYTVEFIKRRVDGNDDLAVSDYFGEVGMRDYYNSVGEILIPRVVFTDTAVRFIDIIKDTSPFDKLEKESGFSFRRDSNKINANSATLAGLVAERNARLKQDANVYEFAKKFFSVTDLSPDGSFTFENVPSASFISQAIHHKSNIDKMGDVFSAAFRDAERLDVTDYSSYTSTVDKKIERAKETASIDFFGRLVRGGNLTLQGMRNLNPTNMGSSAFVLRSHIYKTRLLDNHIGAIKRAKELYLGGSNPTPNVFAHFVSLFAYESLGHIIAKGKHRAEMEWFRDKLGEFDDANGNKATLIVEDIAHEMTTEFNNKANGFKTDYKDIQFEGTFKSGLQEAVAKVFADNINGITPENMQKELQKINSSGLAVIEEARVTGFLDYLKERSLIKRENGKTEKLNVADTESFLKANSLTVRVERDAKFDVGDQNYFVGQQHDIQKYHTVTARVQESKFFPAQRRGGNHVGKDAIVWVRYTLRDVDDPVLGRKKVMYIEEIQANNDGTYKAKAEQEQERYNQYQGIREKIAKVVTDSLNDIENSNNGIKLNSDAERFYRFASDEFAADGNTFIKDDLVYFGSEKNYDDFVGLLIAAQRDAFKKSKHGVRRLAMMKKGVEFQMRVIDRLADEGLRMSDVSFDAAMTAFNEFTKRVIDFDNNEALVTALNMSGSPSEFFGNEMHAYPSDLRSFSNGAIRFQNEFFGFLRMATPEQLAMFPRTKEFYDNAVSQKRRMESRSERANFIGRIMEELFPTYDRSQNMIAKVGASLLVDGWAEKINDFADSYIERAIQHIEKFGMDRPKWFDETYIKDSVGSRMIAERIANGMLGNDNKSLHLQSLRQDKYRYITSRLLNRVIWNLMVDDFMKVPDSQIHPDIAFFRKGEMRAGRYSDNVIGAAADYFFHKFIKDNLVKGKEQAVEAIANLPIKNSDAEGYRLLMELDSGREAVVELFLRNMTTFDNMTDIRYLGRGSGEFVAGRGIAGFFSFAATKYANKTRYLALRRMAADYLNKDYYNFTLAQNLNEYRKTRLVDDQKTFEFQHDMLVGMYDIIQEANAFAGQGNSFLELSQAAIRNYTSYVDPESGSNPRDGILQVAETGRIHPFISADGTHSMKVDGKEVIGVDSSATPTTSRIFSSFEKYVSSKMLMKLIERKEQGHKDLAMMKADDFIESVVAGDRTNASLLMASRKIRLEQSGILDKIKKAQLSDILRNSHPDIAEVLGAKKDSMDGDVFVDAVKVRDAVKKLEHAVKNNEPKGLIEQLIKEKDNALYMLGGHYYGTDFLYSRNVEERKRLLNLPFISSNEYVKIAARMAIKAALVAGANEIVITHPHDGGSRSGLPQVKAEYMYAKLFPEIFKKDYKNKGLEVKQRGFADIPEIKPYVEAAFFAGQNKLSAEKNIMTKEFGSDDMTVKEELVDSLKQIAAQVYGYEGENTALKRKNYHSVPHVIESLKKLTFERKAYSPRDSQQMAHTGTSFGYAGSDIRLAMEMAVKSAILDNRSGIGIIKEEFAKNSHDFSRNLMYDGLLQVFEAFYPDHLADKAKNLHRDRNTPDTAERIEMAKDFFFKVEQHPEYNKIAPLIDWAKFVMAEIDAQYNLGRAILDHSLVKNGGLNALISRRGTTIDLRAMPTKAVDAVMSGTTAFKPIDENTSFSDVSQGTRAFRSRFLSDYAKDNHRLADAVRITVEDRDHDKRMKTDLSLVLRPRGKKRLGMDSNHITVDAHVDFENRAATIQVIDRDASGEYAELARKEMIRRIEIMGIEIKDVIGDTEPVRPIYEGMEDDMPVAPKLGEAELKKRGFVGEFSKSMGDRLEGFSLEEYNSGNASRSADETPTAMDLYLKHNGKKIGEIHVGVPSPKADRSKYFPHVYESYVDDRYQNMGFGKLLYSEVMQRMARKGFTKLTGMQMDPWRRPEKVRRAIAGKESTRHVGGKRGFEVLTNEWGSGVMHNIETDIDPNASYKPKATADRTAWTERTEGNGLTVTSLDGYLIMLSKSGGYRLYSPQKALIGVYKSEEEARKKAARLAQATAT